ncbi:MAG TPA: glycine betaine ABC transporter substrate-binding protein [Alkalispirochaeta sp.]|nr:glycine betaine ABC transporter substrate-binding protein [Alkalispirochaeta sp.]
MQHRRQSAPVLIAGFVLIVLAGCIPSDDSSDGTDRDTQPVLESDRTGATIRLAYPEWSSEIASAHLFQAVLQDRLGYRVELIPVPVEEMWKSVAEGEADILVGAWLPVTHRDYAEEYGDRLVDLGPNLEGARVGLVVPTSTPGRQTDSTGSSGRELVTIRSIPEMSTTVDRFAGRITGIESGAGVMARTRDALEVYGLDRDYRVLDTAESVMVDRVAEAVFRDNWIVVTGWTPHWMFERYSLRFLDDPEGVFGGPEAIHTMIREGFAEDFPDAATVVDNVAYEPRDLERLMRWIHEDDEGDAYGQALRWINSHESTVDEWITEGD